MTSRLKGGAIFLHVPKTGGTWVYAALERCGLLDPVQPSYHVHADMVRVMNRARFGHDRDMTRRVRMRRVEKVCRRLRWFRSWAEEPELDAFTFCFVRHPLKWYESFWRSGVEVRHGERRDNPAKFVEVRKMPKIDEWHPFNELLALERADFNETMCEIARHSPGFVSQLYARYATPRCNFVGKQECLADDLVRVLRLLNLNFDEQRLRETAINNSSPRVPITWDPFLRELFEKLESPALYQFGYQELPV